MSLPFKNMIKYDNVPVFGLLREVIKGGLYGVTTMSATLDECKQDG